MHIISTILFSGLYFSLSELPLIALLISRLIQGIPFVFDHSVRNVLLTQCICVVPHAIYSLNYLFNFHAQRKYLHILTIHD